MWHRSFLSFAGLIMAVILTACGGPASPSTNLSVTMTDFTYTPNTFTVPPGEKITFSIRNNGAVTHSLFIMKAGYKVSGHFTDADKLNVYWQEEKIAPGQSVSDTFTSPSEPGEYQVLCDVAGHLEAGMVAKLVVVEHP